jgi:hypothetical protein
VEIALRANCHAGKVNSMRIFKNLILFNIISERMRTVKTTMLSFIFILFGLCSSKSQELIDPSIREQFSFRVGEHLFTTKSLLGCNSLLPTGSDTLHLVICGDYGYYPFGTIRDTSEIKQSLLKDFTLKDSLLGTPGQWQLAVQFLTRGSDTVVLFPDLYDEGPVRSYIAYAGINTGKRELANDVKIGMSTIAFYKTFFDRYHKKSIKRIRVIVFETCVTGISHIYTFRNNKLLRVRFIQSSLR